MGVLSDVVCNLSLDDVDAYFIPVIPLKVDNKVTGLFQLMDHSGLFPSIFRGTMV